MIIDWYIAKVARYIKKWCKEWSFGLWNGKDIFLDFLFFVAEFSTGLALEVVVFFEGAFYDSPNLAFLALGPMFNTILLIFIIYLARDFLCFLDLFGINLGDALLGLLELLLWFFIFSFFVYKFLKGKKLFGFVYVG